MLEKSDIDNLANLARLDLSLTEKEELQKDLESILGYVSELQKAEVVSGEGERQEPSNYPLLNVLREDEVEVERADYTEDILKQAPKTKNNYFVVKKILGDSTS